jgi:hypothetical protein
MDQQTNKPADPVIVPDVATEPHPTVHVPPLPSDAGEKARLPEVPPEVLEAARKVGGFKKLAELALQLDRESQEPSCRSG